MNLTDTCIDCLLSRVVFECQIASADKECSDRTLDACRELLESMKGSTLLHPQIASAVHREACRRIAAQISGVDYEDSGGEKKVENFVDRLARSVFR